MFANTTDIRAYLAAVPEGGSAILSVKSLISGDHRTFRFRRARPAEGSTRIIRGGFFIDVLTGPDNGADYTYVAWMADASPAQLKFKNAGAPAAPALQWFAFALYTEGKDPLRSADVWHDGRCAKCGRTLTTPESVESGIGPVCASKA